MKTHFYPLVTLCVALACTSAEVSAERVARAYDIRDVSEVMVGGASELQLVQGDSDSLRVEGDAELMNYVSVDQSGQSLALTVKDVRNKGSNPLSLLGDNTVTFYLQLKNLASLKVQGASHGVIGDWVGKSLVVHGSGASELEFATLKLDDLQLRLDGASEMKMKSLSAGSAKLNLSGASEAQVSGQSKFLLVDASGASEYSGKDLKSARAEAKASGASDIELSVAEYLKADASGASNISYRGAPELHQHSSGSSDINSI